MNKDRGHFCAFYSQSKEKKTNERLLLDGEVTVAVHSRVTPRREENLPPPEA